MPAYLIVDVAIHDPQAYERYKPQARRIAEKHGGEYLARGGDLTVFESDLWTPRRLVVICFPDAAAAKAFIDDPEYQPVRAMRRAAAAATVALVEGAPG